MFGQVKYNEISDDLRKLLEKARKAQGESVIFRLNSERSIRMIDSDNAKTNIPSFPIANVPNTDRIVDRDSDGNVKYVDLAYFKNWLPATKDGLPARPNFLDIWFQDVATGQLILSPRTDQPLIDYLRLTNRNRDSINPDKEEPRGGYLFYEVKPQETEKQRYDRERMVDLAKRKIEEAENEELVIMADNFRIATSENGGKLTDYQLKLRLRTVAERDPEALIRVTSDAAGQLRALVQKAVSKELIEFDSVENAWRKTDTKEILCQPKAGEDAETSMVSFLQLNKHVGEPTRVWLLEAVEKSKQQRLARAK